MIGHKIKVYNLPQRVEGGVKIHGVKMADNKDATVLFQHLDGAYGRCIVEGTDNVVNIHASTPLVELENGEWKIDTEAEDVKST